MKCLVTVLMSTYNGEKYLKEQLESILFQEGVNVQLIVRDDGSTDDTLKILKEYAYKYENIKIIEDNRNLGACKSFLYLMSNTMDSEYFALSDQDDIWDKNKLLVAVNYLKEQQADIPLLYYSNLRIVDYKNRYYRNSHKVPHVADKRYACFIENLGTGCTIVYNQKLAQIVHIKQPKCFSMHDAWAYMVCVIFGKVIYDFEPHINYRQHDSNEIGTSKYRIGLIKILQELKIIFNDESPRYENAKEFIEEFNDELTSVDKKKIEKFISYKKSFIDKVKVISDIDFKSNSLYRNLRFKVQILLNRF